MRIQTPRHEVRHCHERPAYHRSVSLVLALLVAVAVGVAPPDGQLVLAQEDSPPPTISSHSPAANAGGVSPTVTVTATFSEPIQPYTISFLLRDSANAIVPAALSYDPPTRTVTLDPLTDLSGSRTFTATVSGVRNFSGTPMPAPVVWSFTTTAGFQDSVVFDGLVHPTVVQFAPDGRIFVAERSGLIKIFDGLASTTPTVFADLRANVYGDGHSGLFGMALDPSFPATPYVYVLYTHNAPIGGAPGACPPGAGACAVSSRLSRLVADGNVMTGAEQVLIHDWYQRYPGQSVGSLAFGPDGALYASAGDGASATFVDHGQTDTPSPDPPSEGGALRSQDLTTPADRVTLNGAVIRVHPDTGRPLPQTTSMLVGAPTVDANGVKSFLVTSVFQGPTPTIVRVLEPTHPAPGNPRRVLYVLPIQVGVTGLSSFYGDGLEELRLLDIHNRYNLTVIAPSFHIEPWYGDHDSDLDRRLESFIVRDLVPFGDSFAAPGEIPERWLVGFSKSGTGALALILRHPNVFSAAAAWAGPAQFTDMSEFPGMVANFGTEENFDRYEIPTLVVTSAEAFRARNRLWISGGESEWASHMTQLASQMAQAGVLHTFVPTGPHDHNWFSGWLDGAIASLHAQGTPDAPVDANMQRIIAHGLRHPLRFVFRPGTDEIWVGDAGWRDWEEINRIESAADGVVENFGWPCYEGDGPNAYADAGLGICTRLDAEPAAVTPPFYAFHHGQPAVPGDECGAGAGSISGLAFYGTGGYPATYEGALFFADSARGCIWALFKGADGRPDPTNRVTVLAGAASPVDLKIGPGGDLFYVDFEGGTIRRVGRATGDTGNLPPTAVMLAGPLAGPAPLTVQFDGQGSSDPGGATLAYAWDLDGDGAFDDSDSPRPSFVYTVSGPRTVRLRVTDPQGLSDVAAVVVTVTNTAPTATITAPLASVTWRAGQVIAFAGLATDTEQGPLPASSLAWSLILHHCASGCGSSTLGNFVGVAGGNFVAPDHGPPSRLELRLTATDAGGLRDTASVQILPRAVTPPDPANLGVYRQSTGEWFVLEPSGVVNVTLWGTATLGDRPVREDYDGDGKADIAVFRPTSGEWFVLGSTAGFGGPVLFGAPGLGDVPVPADYDGDGKADLAVFRHSTGQWFVFGSTTGFPGPVLFGAPGLGDVPVPADYDGDGKADLAVFRHSTGQWFVFGSTTGFPGPVLFGAPGLGDVPVPADYDGDGKADLAVFRHSTGQWFVFGSTTGFPGPVLFGAPSLGDVPVPADYDGDGKADLAVFRYSTGQWFIFGSSAGFGSPVLFGAPSLGDVPITQRTMSP